MSENYYSDCCWAHVEVIEWLPQNDVAVYGKCMACGEASGNILTQEMINRKIKECLTRLEK